MRPTVFDLLAVVRIRDETRSRNVSRVSGLTKCVLRMINAPAAVATPFKQNKDVSDSHAALLQNWGMKFKNDVSVSMRGEPF